MKEGSNESRGISPTLYAMKSNLPAFELKFVLPIAVAEEVERYLSQRMEIDPNAKPVYGNSYPITSVYFDTPDSISTTNPKDINGGSFACAATAWAKSFF